MRIMYDAVNIANIPSNATMIAPYIDGHIPGLPNYDLARQLFPHALLVPIASQPGTKGGVVLDCESYDWTAAQTVQGISDRRQEGVEGTVYCNMDTWPSVRSAFDNAKIREPNYWLAIPGATHIPPGAVAVQFNTVGGHDISMVADYWPGVDIPIQPITLGVSEMPFILKDPDSDAQFLGINGDWIHVPTIPDLAWEEQQAKIPYAPIVDDIARVIIQRLKNEGKF